MIPAIPLKEGADVFSIPGYKIYGTLFQGTRGILYRGERESDHKPILIKAKQHGCPLPSFESSIRNDYEITKDLQIQGVLKPYALERHAHGLVLILEDTGARPLRTLLSSRRMGLEAFLKLAISLANILGELHRNKIIHKDINPNHIFVNPHSAQVKLAGFGAASLLSHEETRIVIHGGLEGAIAYISPEQTGMMNRVLDYRTDLYSLGACRTGNCSHP
jgi:serine/threonine protein kinase